MTKIFQEPRRKEPVRASPGRITLWHIWFWPDVSVGRKAQHAIGEGVAAAAFVCVVALIVEFVSLNDNSQVEVARGAVYLAVAFGAIAVGILLRWRAAAVAGLVLYVAERLLAWPSIEQFSLGKDVLWPCVITMMFVNGVRGTFAYHNMPPAPVRLPPVEQSFRLPRLRRPTGQRRLHRRTKPTRGAKLSNAATNHTQED